MSFNPDALNNKNSLNNTVSSAPKKERLIMVVENYETPESGFHYAVGHKFDDVDAKVRVRLNTVDERCKDRPKTDQNKIREQYVSGENTRDTIADKKKSNIKFISFDDSLLLTEKDGVSEYRAHWGKTMSTDPTAEIISGVGHIRLRQPENGSERSAEAYIEFIKDAQPVVKKNIKQQLTSGLAIKDEQGRARDPFVIIRVGYQDKLVTTVRLFPATETKAIFDQNLGANKEIRTLVDSEKTIEHLLSGKPLSNSPTTAYIDNQADTVRAVVAGLLGRKEPTFNDPSNKERNLNIYHGAKGGQLNFELISAEKIDFGIDSRKTYLNEKSRPHLAAYDIKSGEEGNEKQQFVTSGYTETVLAIHRHPDGEPYAVFASPKEMWPKTQVMKNLTIDKLIITTPENKPVHEEEKSAKVNKEESSTLSI
ncbi:hypothetical protein ACQIBV_003771 [Yersinia enterocolitica]|uniref:hypothetical protein n=1 Tax=Yersinia TaxID=629 RepID=UPI0005E73912|nr:MULTISPECIES: hypothetical protein [Yersinia]EKN3395589.1 hypothetical protein [Yersinia enterocolitica]EKN3501152.1 hypothetical protein [Yersinia enterocolitica]EKN3636604.1 hypothetical protein [Yersinia enterocolitica]EKN3687166.1 hypothetical protein [Yersinia enterocolitica]EKN3832500.1 hypothetical protein [Yersinia enterocolitica]